MRRLAPLVLWLLLAGPAAAQGTDWKQGKLGHLAPLIGTFAYDTVLDDPQVAAKVKALLGDAAPVLRRNLAVHPGIDFIAGSLVLQGNAEHRGGEEEAMLWLHVYDGQVRAALLHAGRFYLYSAPAEWAYLPRELRAFFTPRRFGKPPQPPAGLVWVGR